MDERIDTARPYEPTRDVGQRVAGHRQPCHAVERRCSHAQPRARSSSNHPTRRRWTAEEARQVLTAWEESGLELTSFASSEGLDPQRLTRWRRRLATGAPTFEEVAPCVAMAPLAGDVSTRAKWGAGQEVALRPS